jgi:formamidopyrimidine-DNA glycosylase
VVQGRDALKALDPGGVEPLSCSLEEFAEALVRENRTLKRALTNPRAFSGIGNAYSDEILHAARLSPLRLTRQLAPEEVERLFEAARQTLSDWTERLRREPAGKFPGRGQVTAFRPDFAVHGKYGQPCPVCGKPVQRISYAENEINYCAQCQNEGRMLADRSLSRLLKDDWPKTIDEMLGE